MPTIASAATEHECTMQAPGEPTNVFYLSSPCTGEPDMSGNWHRLKTKGVVHPQIFASSAQQFTGTILGTPAAFECSTLGSSSGSVENFEEGGASKIKGSMVFKYTGCSISKPSGCKINGEANGSAKLTTETLNTLATTTGGASSVKFSPSGEKLFTLKLTGCAAEGSFKATGSVTGAVPGTDESLVEFTSTSGSALTLAGNPATYTGNTKVEKEGTTQVLLIGP
ncbi:MAG TPA: hypothetical protein VN522_12585 [Solirubrobacterales bacterium]|nr:hypothetical protein [Solirubrobacterales bacterium]